MEYIFYDNFLSLAKTRAAGRDAIATNGDGHGSNFGSGRNGVESVLRLALGDWLGSGCALHASASKRNENESGIVGRVRRRCVCVALRALRACAFNCGVARATIVVVVGHFCEEKRFVLCDDVLGAPLSASLFGRPSRAHSFVASCRASIGALGGRRRRIQSMSR